MGDDPRMGEARVLGSVLPCRWTVEQRERVIALTAMTPAQVDAIIAVSRMMNERNGSIFEVVMSSAGARAFHVWDTNYDGYKYCTRCGHLEHLVHGSVCRP